MSYHESGYYFSHVRCVSVSFTGIFTDMFAVIQFGHGSLGKVVDGLLFSRYLRRLFGRAFRLDFGSDIALREPVAQKALYFFFFSHLKIP